MSDYLIGLCEALEEMTGADFDTLMYAMTENDVFPDGLPNPEKRRDMRKLYRRLRPYMDK